MIIYVVESAGGYYEDKYRNIEMVTENDEAAYGLVRALRHEHNYISLWEDGRLISEYFRDFYKDDRGDSFSKWERNCGAINPHLESYNEHCDQWSKLMDKNFSNSTKE